MLGPIFTLLSLFFESVSSGIDLGPTLVQYDLILTRDLQKLYFLTGHILSFEMAMNFWGNLVNLLYWCTSLNLKNIEHKQMEIGEF